MPENIEEIQPEASESTPQTAEDVWSKEIDFTPKDEDSAEGSPVETPSEEVETVEDKPEEPEEETETTETAEEVEEKEDDSDDSSVPRLSRRKLRDLEVSVIHPFRDPTAPITDAIKGLMELNPTRANELIDTLVYESATRHPNEWLEHITDRKGITKDQVIEALDRVVEPQPAEKQQYENELQAAITSLDELYPNWRESDEELIDTDLPLVNFIRSQLNTKPNARESALEEKLRLATEQLDTLKPQVEAIKTVQEKAFEEKVQTNYQKSFEDYRQSVEGDARPKFLKETGLAVTESDPPEVKALKEVALSRFESQDGYMSDFDMFATNKFSGAEKLTKAVERVDRNLAQAARLEASAEREKDQAKAEENRTKAKALRADADNDRDILKVLNKKALKEFAESPSVKPLASALETIAQLRQQLARITGGRVEIVGQTATATPHDWREELRERAKEKGSPWDSDILDERFAAMGR